MITGHTEPRVYTPPLRVLTPETSLGFALADFCKRVLKQPLLPWQEWLAIHALELVDGGRFRYRTVVALVGRQNGKTLLTKALALFFLYKLHAQMVIGTAQNLDTSTASWNAAVTDIEENDLLRREFSRTLRGAGNRVLELTGNRTYKVASATRKSGRGLSADLVLMDELREHTDWESWGAVTKTTMAKPGALVWCISNAGDAKSVVLRHLRTQAHALLGDPDGIAADLELLPGDSLDTTTLGFFEWSAEPDCLTSDREAWAAANPSLGYGFMTEGSLLSAQKTDPEDVFRTECLCQWVTARVARPFPDGSWEAGTDKASYMARDGERFFGLDVSSDRKNTSLAVCGMRNDRTWHVEVIQSRQGIGWAMDWLRSRAAAKPVKLAVQGRGAPVSSYLADLSAIDGLELVAVEGRDLGAYCGRFYDGVAACTDDSDAVPIHHRPQPILDDAAAVAQKRGAGDSAWLWDRQSSGVDIAPLVACTMAFGLATMGRTETRTTTYSTAYTEDRGLIVI